MTTYSYDPALRSIHASWESGRGSMTRSVTLLNTSVPERAGLRLAKALTDLSEAAWLSYRHPSLCETGICGGDEATVLQALRRPNLPLAGLLHREPDLVSEFAHKVGRRLVEVGSAGVARAVAADVSAELRAVAQAQLGDLSGRAQQAVAITRPTASPTQVDAADRLLHEVPMGSERLFTEVEPTAAAVAAAHWLQAATEVLLRATGETDPHEAMAAAADDAGADMSVALATIDCLRSGDTPTTVVTSFVGTAIAAGGGIFPALVADEGDSLHTLLDPQAPGRDMVESLVKGIGIAFAAFVRHGHQDERLDDVRALFHDAVRDEAARHRDRLTAVDGATV